MSAIKIDLEQGSETWHSWRAKGVGASDVPAILNKSPYKTKRDLVLSKMGLGDGEDLSDNWAIKRGNHIEPIARALFNKQFEIKMIPTCFERDEIFLASLDGYQKGKGILEIKFTGAKVLTEAKKGIIPEHHRIQIQSQLFASEEDKAYWCGHTGKAGHVVEIGRDEKLIKQIEAEVPLFWDMVQNCEVPELGPNDTKYLTAAEDRALIAKLIKMRQQKDEIEAQYKELENMVKSIADHEKVQCGNVVISAVERKGTINYKSIPTMKELDAEALEAFRGKGSVYKKITFKKEGENE